jgi:hypothetical protein
MRLFGGWSDEGIFMRRIWPLPDLALPNVRIFVAGPRRRRAFGICRRSIAEVAPRFAGMHRAGKQLWWFDLEDDVRELVMRHEIRPGVTAEWTDPREWLAR